MRRIGFRHQRTIANPATVRGVGIVTGTPVTLRFLPAAPDTGLTFVRTDLNFRPTTPAEAQQVTGTARRTTLGEPDTGVTLVEHVLSALAGLRIDNCLIELNAVEPPGLDGSSIGFVEALLQAGPVLQASRRPIYAPEQPVILRQGAATIALHPPMPDHPTRFQAQYILDYGPNAVIARQVVSTVVTPELYVHQIADARTFLLESEAEALRQQGIGRHLTAAEVLVFGRTGLIDNNLRYADEPARHKVLDLVGDLALCGFDLAGQLIAYRSGHRLNADLAATLVEQVAQEEEAAHLLPQILSFRNRRAA